MSTTNISYSEKNIHKYDLFAYVPILENQCPRAKPQTTETELVLIYATIYKEQNFPFPYVTVDHINTYPMALLMKSHESVHMYLIAKFT